MGIQINFSACTSQDMYPHTDKTQRWAFKFSDVLTCESPCPNTTQIWTKDNIFYFEFTIGLKIFSNFTGKPVESKYLFQGRKGEMFAGDLLPCQKQSRSTLVPKSFHKKHPWDLYIAKKHFGFNAQQVDSLKMFLSSHTRVAAPAKPPFLGTLEFPCHWQSEPVLVFP